MGGTEKTSVDSLVQARDIAIAVRDAGGRAFFVGGWVRDRIMGRESTNVDIEVFSVPADRLRTLLESFGHVEAVGASFQVFKLGDLDISLPRRDSKSGRGHKGFEVTGDPFMSIEDAARRRDFRVNAILWDPLTDQYEDPFDGRGDIERRVLRVVDPATFEAEMRQCGFETVGRKLIGPTDDHVGSAVSIARLADAG